MLVVLMVSRSQEAMSACVPFVLYRYNIWRELTLSRNAASQVNITQVVARAASRRATGSEVTAEITTTTDKEASVRAGQSDDNINKELEVPILLFFTRDLPSRSLQATAYI
jgi:hypothetical protein